MKRRIVQLIGKISDGGAESLIRNYALYLNNDEFETVIVTIRDNEVLSGNYKVLQAAGIRIVTLDHKDRKYDIILNKLFGKYYRALKLLILVIKEKVCVVHGHLNVLEIMQPLVKLLKKCSFYYTCHSEVQAIFDDSKLYRAGKQVSKQSNFRFIVLHKKMKQDLDRLFNIKTSIVLSNGVDFNRFKKGLLNPDEIREKLNIPVDAYVVGHIGRFSEEKNHHFLIKVFDEIHKLKNNSYLILIGRGRLYQSIVDQVDKYGLSENVIFLSNRTDVNELLQAMDCFLLPSQWEGLSLALIEAQACSLKCVISDSINSANILSGKTIPVNLSLEPKEWAGIVLDPYIDNPYHGDLNECNIETVVEKLKKIYFEDSQ